MLLLIMKPLSCSQVALFKYPTECCICDCDCSTISLALPLQSLPVNDECPAHSDRDYRSTFFLARFSVVYSAQVLIHTYNLYITNQTQWTFKALWRLLCCRDLATWLQLTLVAFCHIFFCNKVVIYTALNAPCGGPAQYRYQPVQQICCFARSATLFGQHSLARQHGVGESASSPGICQSNKSPHFSFANPKKTALTLV